MKMRVTFSGAFDTIGELKEILKEMPVELDNEQVKIERDDYDYYDTWVLSVTINPASVEAIECGNHVPTRGEDGKFIIKHKDLIVNLHECSAD